MLILCVCACTSVYVYACLTKHEWRKFLYRYKLIISSGRWGRMYSTRDVHESLRVSRLTFVRLFTIHATLHLVWAEDQITEVWGICAQILFEWDLVMYFRTVPQASGAWYSLAQRTSWIAQAMTDINLMQYSFYMWRISWRLNSGWVRDPPREHYPSDNAS